MLADIERPLFSESLDPPLDNAEILDVVMPVYNLLEYNDHFSSTSRKFWQYCLDEPNGNVVNSESFNYRLKFTSTTNITAILLQ